MTTAARTRVRAAAPAPAPSVEQDQPLHVKYRPTKFSEVVGQGAVVKSLRDALNKPTKPHAFLLVGPAGCGKTTLARLVAQELKCDPSNVIEVDAATNNGIDNMRELMAPLRYQGFGGTPNKALIVDEAHAISKAAWQALLKSVEEPPQHVFWVFCTTEAGKIPDTIVSRCHTYTLRSVGHADLMDLLEHVAEAEKLDAGPAMLQAVARACGGSPRQALVQLSMVEHCGSMEEVQRVLETPVDNAEVIELCRLLLDRDLTWAKLTGTLKRLEGMTAESVRIVVVNYLAACLLGAKSDKEAQRLLDLLYPFSKPFATSDKLAPLLLAFGDVMFA